MEQEEPKVSVIIPVYNTEAYVRQAISSIQNQTLQQLEIIVVNDGSTDGSSVILHELASADSRMRVYEQANQGLSVTRNVGFSHARGRYIYFMDSDDLLEADALELCCAKCEAEELDFVFFDAKSFYDNLLSPTTSQNYIRTKALKQKEYTGIEALNAQLRNYQFTPSACLNVIRHTFLDEHQLHFYPGILHEDQLFTSLLYLHAQRTNFICRTFFQRRMRQNSIMTCQFTWRNMEGYLTVTRELLHFGANRATEIRQTIDLLLSQMLNAAVWHAYVLPLNQRLKLLTICLMHYRRYVSNRTLGTLILKSTFRNNKIFTNTNS